MQVYTATFQEYFVSDECEDQAVSGIGFIGPSFKLAANKAWMQPSQAYPDYASGCAYGEVNGCIPGIGCGAPYTFLLAGGKTNRTTAKDQPLW